MAVGFALTFLAGFLVPSDPCDLVVQGRYEPSAYLDAVRLYRDGNRDEARKALARLDDDEVDHFIERIDTLREKFQPSALENFVPEDVCFEAACLLEAELAMAHVEALRWNEADRHFDAGWRVSFLIDSPKLQGRFQRDWLLAVGLFHHGRIFQRQDPQAPFERADRFLQDARRRYPQDFEVLMAAGALLELSGSLPEGDRDHLKQAEALYTQALRVSPDDPEALLRHGWVLRRLGKTHEAEGPLRRVLELASEDNLIYRSRMALGGTAEREGRLNEAVADYQAAAAVEPAWQVAYLAWAEVLHRQGAHDRAREVLKRALAISPSEARNDGWWQYELGLVRLLDPLLDRMRTEVTK